MPQPVNHVSWKQCHTRAKGLAHIIHNLILSSSDPRKRIRLYGIPRGGDHAASLVIAEANDFLLPLGYTFERTDDPTQADFFIDDLVDSGKTKEWYEAQYKKPFLTLFNKQTETMLTDKWIVFPWEMHQEKQGPEENIVRLLQFIGEDPKREGLKDTPKRVIKSYAELFAGYKLTPAEVMKTFKHSTCNEMVVVKNIEFFSTCEHHMLPFFGKAHIAYIPNGKVIGVSKLARILDIYARRLQIQERLCEQVTAALDQNLQPKGSACILEASHLCMRCRGVSKQNSVMVTSSLTGVFLEAHTQSRTELLQFVNNR